MIVILTISATISALGIWGLVVFRETAQLDQAEREIVSILQTYQNKARNSVISEARFLTTGNQIQSQVDGFAIFFTNGSYSLRYCTATLGAGSTTFDCRNTESAPSFPDFFNTISFTVQDSGCNGILFERVTGRISAMNSEQGVPSDAVGICTITVRHLTAGRTRDVDINVQYDSFI